MLRLRAISIAFILMFCCCAAWAQFSDSFDDCNYTTSPTWLTYSVDAQITNIDNDGCAVVLSAPNSNSEASFVTVNTIYAPLKWTFILEFDANEVNYIDVVFAASNYNFATANLRYLRLACTENRVRVVQSTPYSTDVILDEAMQFATGKKRYEVTIDNRNGEHSFAVAYDAAFIFAASAEMTPESLTFFNGIRFSAPEQAEIVLFHASAIDDSNPPTVHDNGLVFTEIMHRPSPTVGLPDAEYIEIFNSSPRAVDLKGLSVSSSSKIGYISASHSLEPQSYACLCSANAAEMLEGMAQNIVVVESMPSLLNDGDCIELSSQGTTMARLCYTNDWYDEKWKSAGGWSLERRDATNPNDNALNWCGSCSSIGGTPGYKNCASGEVIDTLLPQLMSIGLADDRTIALRFNKVMAQPDAGAIAVHGATLRSVNFDATQPTLLNLIVGERLSSEYHITLEINSLYCASGYPLDTIFDVALPIAAGYMDLVINEVMAYVDDDHSKFIELYNTTSNFIDLKEVSLCSFDAEGAYKTLLPLSDVSLLLAPDCYAVVAPHLRGIRCSMGENINSCYIERSLPSLPYKEGRIGVCTRSGTLLDKVAYSSTWHHPLIRDAHNVSLERISAIANSNDSTNWHSASSAVGYNTAGFRNSHSHVAHSDGERDIYFVEQFITPDNDGANDYATLVYTLPSADYTLTINIYTRSGSFVANIADLAPVAASGKWLWHGTTSTGKAVESGIYVVVVHALNPITGDKFTRRLTIVVDYR